MGPQLPIRLGRHFRRGESDQDKIGMTLGHIKTQGPAFISESLADLYFRCTIERICFWSRIAAVAITCAGTEILFGLKTLRIWVVTSMGK